jgi:hypothetical protein
MLQTDLQEVEDENQSPGPQGLVKDLERSRCQEIASWIWRGTRLPSVLQPCNFTSLSPKVRVFSVFCIQTNNANN